MAVAKQFECRFEYVRGRDDGALTKFYFQGGRLRESVMDVDKDKKRFLPIHGEEEAYRFMLWTKRAIEKHAKRVNVERLKKCLSPEEVKELLGGQDVDHPADRTADEPARSDHGSDGDHRPVEEAKKPKGGKRSGAKNRKKDSASKGPEKAEAGDPAAETEPDALC